jgi:hypothetical protein
MYPKEWLAQFAIVACKSERAKKDVGRSSTEGGSGRYS